MNQATSEPRYQPPVDSVAERCINCQLIALHATDVTSVTTDTTTET